MAFTNHHLDTLKSASGWLLANGQTVRWVTEKVVIRKILAASDFQSFLKSLRKGTSVDIGCAGGRYLIDFLVPRSAAVVGLEYNRSHLALVQSRVARGGLGDRVSICQAKAEQLPLDDNSVEFVMCTQVLEHLPSPAKGIDEIERILCPGGRGILSIPIPPDPMPNPEHLHKDFIPSRLDAMVMERGMRILRQEYCMYAISRRVAWLVGNLRIPLPLNPLCHLEQVTSGFIPWPRPHVYICAIEKAF